MVPIQKKLTETQEDPSHTTEAERWKHYGQNDHLRIFSRNDLVKRLTQSGFEVAQYRDSDFSSYSFQKCGIKEGSVLYVVNK